MKNVEFVKVEAVGGDWLESQFKKYIQQNNMLKSQIKIIYSRLSEAPKLYETDGAKIRDVAVKLFHSLFTLYVVEYDPKDKLAFGYMKNEEDEYLSEWGYSSIEELLELGFEMDLYFEDRTIAFDGTISKKESHAV